jgi:hypothetical protein
MPQYPFITAGLRSCSSPLTTRAWLTTPSVGCCRTLPSVPNGLAPCAQIVPYGLSESAYPQTIRSPNRRSISRWRASDGDGPV